MAINKIIYGGDVLLDLTGDTAVASDVKAGATFHDKSGEVVTGTNDYDSNTDDATAAVAEILSDKTAYARGAKITGTMPNRGAVALELTSRDTPVTIPNGYHDGSGTAGLSSADKGKLIPGNIRQGVQILDVTGSMTSTEGVRPQSKTVTPNKTGFTVLPDTGYNYLSQVVVNAIPYVVQDNTAGGKTVTIG